MTWCSRVFCVIILFLIAAMAPSGPTYDLSWHTIDGGGGLSMGGAYDLHGVIGQHDAGTVASTGGTFSLSGGFFAGAGGALCPADFTSGGGGPDGLVGINDFLGVLAQWGNVCPCTADITGPMNGPPDGLVGILDFLKVLADWGPCP